MRPPRIALAPVMLSAAAFSLAQVAPPDGAIEGIVVNSDTGAGVEGASVTVSTVPSAGRSAKYEATSGIAGRFTITGMAPGSYFARVSKDGFAPQLSGLSFLPESVSSPEPPFRVDAGGDPVQVRLELAPLQTVRGRVLGPDGEPAAGVEVSLSPNIMANQDVTDAEGRFTLEGTRPGSYTLIARPPESAQPEEASDGTRTAIVTTYYPSVEDRSLAQPIVFRGQADLRDYEIRMQTAVVYRVSGIALDENRQPSSGAELSLFPVPAGAPEPRGLSMRPGGPRLFAVGLRQGVRGLPEATAVAGEDGRFEFPAVRSGDWIIRALSAPAPDAPDAHGSIRVSVSRGDAGDLEVSVAAPFQLTATLEWEEGDAGPTRTSNPGPLGVYLMEADGDVLVPGIAGGAQSGELSFDNVLPGRYQLVLASGVSARILQDNREIIGPVQVTADSPPLRVVLNASTGTVRGIAGEGATVVLVPQQPVGVTVGQTMVAGPGGLFELNQVPPGDYYVAAFHGEYRLAPSAAMLSLVPNRGRRVSVEEGSVADVTLPVVPAPR